MSNIETKELGNVNESVKTSVCSKIESGEIRQTLLMVCWTAEQIDHLIEKYFDGLYRGE